MSDLWALAVSTRVPFSDALIRKLTENPRLRQNVNKVKAEFLLGHQISNIKLLLGATGRIRVISAHITGNTVVVFAYRQQPNLANVLAAREGDRAPICSDVVFLDLLEDGGQRVARLSPATFRRSSVKPGDWWQ